MAELLAMTRELKLAVTKVLLKAESLVVSMVDLRVPTMVVQ